MSSADNATNDATQKPETVAVAPSGRPDRAGKRTELGGAVVPVQVVPATVTLPLDLLTEALTVLTIYAEVAVPVASYRGQPLAAHAPRELVERIHRAIGA